MRIARGHGNQHDSSVAESHFPPTPAASIPNLKSVHSTLSGCEYRPPPTPTSLVDTPGSGTGSRGSSSLLPTRRLLDPVGVANSAPKKDRLPLFYRRRHQRDAAQKARGDVALSLKDRQCPACGRRGCLLVSHRLYAAQHTSRMSQPPSAEEEPHVSFTISAGSGRLDPFFDLPVGNSDPEMQQRFRDFFTTQCSSMTSPVRILAFDSAYCPVVLRQALADPALCHTFIAMSATYASIHGHDLQAPDAKLLSTYNRTFQVLRQQIHQTKSGKPSDIHVTAALNLLMCHGLAFGDCHAMKGHSAALRALVNDCGGISNLSGQCAALTLWVDYYVTLYTGKKPVFLDQAGVMSDIPLSNPPEPVYGGGLDDLKLRGVISPALLDVCQNTCRLTELLEDRVSGNTNPARWEYFHYKRNSMPMRNGIVHSELFGSGTKAECISLAHNLYMFLVLRLMPWKAPVVNLCEQLQSALLATGLNDYWSRDIDVLLWVLFILVAGAEHWSGKRWALQLLLDTLSYCYGSEPRNWPLDWREMQRLSLMQFTWSQIYLTESFMATCRELAMTPSSARVSAELDAPAYSAGHANHKLPVKKEYNTKG